MRVLVQRPQDDRWGPEDLHCLPAVAVLLGIFGYVVVKNAWLCDDAFLSLRTVENFLGGYGCTWNVAERVQIFTHPLWLFVLCVSCTIVGNAYFAALTAALAITFCAVFLLVLRLAKAGPSAVLVLIVLSMSKAFIDYSTSGLENPMTHLLLALFFCVYFVSPRNLGSFFVMSLTANFALLNRMDSILLIFPALAAAFFHSRKPPEGIGVKAAIGVFLYSMGPFIAWELFSLWYYGTPFPNSAYAKLLNGIPQMDLIKHGGAYYWNSLAWDPVTLSVILSAVVGAVLLMEKYDFVPAALGIGLYCLYILYIGGDFMSGRFLTGPLFLAAIVFSQMRPIELRPLLLVSAVLILVGLFNPRSPYVASDLSPQEVMRAKGVYDERQYYAERFGLVNVLTERRLSTYRIPETNSPSTEVCIECGFKAYISPRTTHFIDIAGLGDPLLARLEPGASWLLRRWRIGHFLRVIPGGYKESVVSGENRLADPPVRQYYSALHVAARGNLLDPDRLGVIWKLNTGQYRKLTEGYVAASLLKGRLLIPSDVSQPMPDGSQPWAGMGIGPGGATIELGRTVDSPNMKISLTANYVYEIGFLLLGKPFYGVEVGPVNGRGLVAHRISIPRDSAAHGYDTISVRPVQGRTFPAIGYVEFLR
jgi:arabinofuranosyltransferase